MDEQELAQKKRRIEELRALLQALGPAKRPEDQAELKLRKKEMDDLTVEVARNERKTVATATTLMPDFGGTVPRPVMGTPSAKDLRPAMGEALPGSSHQIMQENPVLSPAGSNRLSAKAIPGPNGKVTRPNPVLQKSSAKLSPQAERLTRYGKLADPAFVARALGAQVTDVQKYLPFLLDALRDKEIDDPATIIAALATGAVETGKYRYVEEAGYVNSQAARDAYFDKTKYAKVDPVTGKRYYGRGIVQLTWKDTYAKYGRELKRDFLRHPEEVTKPAMAGTVLAKFFEEKGIPAMAHAGLWFEVRKKVNGKPPRQYAEFYGYVTSLQNALKQQPTDNARRAYQETTDAVARAQALTERGDMAGAHQVLNDQIWRITNPNGYLAKLQQENPVGNAEALRFLKRQAELYRQSALTVPSINLNQMGWEP
ncbi:MAG: glycoside hydrolase family 19 protein [Armatimonadota bacterium]